jgi:hypothetical protein
MTSVERGMDNLDDRKPPINTQGYIKNIYFQIRDTFKRMRLNKVQ